MSSFQNCPVCGNDVTSAMNFCRKCGTNLKEYEQANGATAQAPVAAPAPSQASVATSAPAPAATPVQASVAPPTPAPAAAHPSPAASQPQAVATPPSQQVAENPVETVSEGGAAKVATDTPDISTAFSGIGKGLPNLMGGANQGGGNTATTTEASAPKMPAINTDELKSNFINFFNLNVDSQLTAGEFDPNSALLSNTSEQEVESAFAAMSGMNYAQEEAAYLQFQVPITQGQIVDDTGKTVDDAQQSLLAITEEDEKRERAEDPLAQAMPKEWDLDFLMTGHRRGAEE